MTCATCRYCYESECRRNPPTAAAMIWRGSPEGVRMWPVVDPDDWCGEHPMRRDADRQTDRMAPEPIPTPQPLVAQPIKGWRRWVS